jgi:hypothetical protein
VSAECCVLVDVLLQANVATGAVNLSMDTINQPAGVALSVLGAYVCSVALGAVYMSNAK